MRKAVKKSISLLLTLCMAATMLMPMVAMAENTGSPSNEVVSRPDTLPMVDIIAPGDDAAAPEIEDAPIAVLDAEIQPAAIPEGPCTVQDDNPAIVYTDGASGSDAADGRWSSWPIPAEGPNDIHFFTMPKTVQENETCPSLSLTFNGRGVAIYGEMAKNGPIMSVVIDGAEPENADFFAASKASGKVYEKNGLSDGEHTLVLTFTREYSGTTGDLNNSAKIQAAIDRFEIAGPPVAQTVTVENGTADKATALPGDTVTITAATPAAGMAFRSWSSSDGVVLADPKAPVTTFTMPANPVTVKAGYKLSNSAEIPPRGMTATAPSEETSKSEITKEGPASLVLDGNTNTFWCTDWNVHPTAENRYILLNLGGLYNVDSMSYVERPGSNGRITDYDILVSTDGKTFASVATGTWVPGNKNVQQVDFAPALATHVKLLAVHTEGSPSDAFATAAELRVTGEAVAPITQSKGAAGNVKLNFDATQFPDEGYKYYYSAGKTTVEAPALGEARDATVYTTELTNGAELARIKREYVNVVLVDGNDKVVTFRSIEVTLGEPQEYLVTVEGGTVTGGGQDDEWLPEGGTATITAPEEGEATMTFHHWSSEDGVVFADPTSAVTTFTMPAKAVTVKANYAYPAGTTFYLDAENGSDENTGLTVGAPWKTLGKMENVLLQSGDKVLLKAGSVFEGQSLSLCGSGSEEAPIIVDMYDGATIGTEAGAKPHIKANGIAKADFFVGKEGDTGITSRPSVAYGVHIKNVSHIQVNNLEVTNNSGTRQMAVGVVVEAASGNGVTSGIHLNGLYVHDVYGTLTEKTAPNGGIFMITTPGNGDVAHPTRYDDISVQNCTVADVSRTGISVGSSHSAYYWERHPGGIIPEDVKSKYGHTNVVIRNNYIEEAGGDAIVPQFCIAPLIEYNVSNAASQNTKGDYGAMYNAAIWPWRCEDAIFQFNEAYGTINNGDGQAYDCDFSRGTVYQYNYSHDNEGGFILLCQAQSIQSTVRYNISQNDLDSLFLVSNTEPAEVYNNTFYIGDGLETVIVDGGGPANLKNNIFYSEGTRKTQKWGNFTYDSNLYFGFDNTPTDANKITTDPLFTDPGKGDSGVAGNSAIDTLGGYALREGSPAISAGVIISNNGGRDYSGNLVSDAQKPSLGAMEYVTGYHVVTVEGGTSDKKITSAGDTITITATPPIGKMLDKWVCEDVDIAKEDDAITTFTMPDKDVTVTATFRDIPVAPGRPADPKPEAPKTDAEAGETVVEVPVKPTVSGDKATANVSTKTVTDAVASAAKAAEESGTSANVELAIKAPEKAKTVEVSLPKAAVEAIIKGKTENLIITSHVGEISLDSKALSAIGEAAGSTVKIAITATDASKTETAEQVKLGGAAVFDLTITSGSNAISDFKEGKATVTVPHTLAEGRDAKFVTVWYLAEGKLTPVESTYTDGKASFSTGHFSRYAIGYLPFEDVQAGWYYDSVVYAYNTELFGGIGQNKFAPGDNMTRGALWTVLYRMADATTKGEGDAWYADARAWAVAEGVSDGANPDGNITREQLATILYRYAKGAPATVDMSKFADAADISGFAADAMTWAVERGLLQGADGKLNPQGNASRAEVAIMLQRFVETGAK